MPSCGPKGIRIKPVETLLASGPTIQAKGGVIYMEDEV
jgi:hypothetical protein